MMTGSMPGSSSLVQTSMMTGSMPGSSSLVQMSMMTVLEFLYIYIYI